MYTIGWDNFPVIAYQKKTSCNRLIEVWPNFCSIHWSILSLIIKETGHGQVCQARLVLYNWCWLILGGAGCPSVVLAAAVGYCWCKLLLLAAANAISCYWLLLAAATGQCWLLLLATTFCYPTVIRPVAAVRYYSFCCCFFFAFLLLFLLLLPELLLLLPDVLFYFTLVLVLFMYYWFITPSFFPICS